MINDMEKIKQSMRVREEWECCFVWKSGKASLRRWHLRRDMKRGKGESMAVQRSGENGSRGRAMECKGPEGSALGGLGEGSRGSVGGGGKGVFRR